MIIALTIYYVALCKMPFKKLDTGINTTCDLRIVAHHYWHVVPGQQVSQVFLVLSACHRSRGEHIRLTKPQPPIPPALDLHQIAQ
jgi:hypothetical protein